MKTIFCILEGKFLLRIQKPTTYYIDSWTKVQKLLNSITIVLLQFVSKIFNQLNQIFV